MNDSATTSISSELLTLVISAHGAEPHSLRDTNGTEYLWQAGPAWRRRAPILFPIVCRVPNDTIHHDGRDYPLSQHGFARDSEFALASSDESSARFTLHSTETTRAKFPFDFTLDLDYTLVGDTVTITQTVTNTGDEPLGASAGNHPAFPWPLPGAASRADHTIAFAEPEPEGYHRAPENLLLPEAHPSPLVDDVLAIDDTILDDGVLIFTERKARTLTYSAPGAATITVRSGDFGTLGVWAPVGAEFVCIEPWAGYPAPLGWDGDILDKPGQFRLEPGSSAAFSYSITIEPAI